MADPRTIGSIAERYDLDWRRHPNPWLRWRWRAGWLCFALGLLLVGVPWARGNRTLFLSRPVSDPHRWFENECTRCHDRPGTPLLRWVTARDDLRSVSAGACRQCHVQESDDHHVDALQQPFKSDCAECHKEHRGHSLRDVPDQKCLRCHDNLSGHIRSGHQLAVTAQVLAWESHPEFAVKRDTRSFSDLDHIVRVLADADAATNRWRDKARIRFNHKVHLVPDGIPVPPGHPEFHEGRTLKKLACQDCHVPDAAGEAMQPVRFDAHCAPCHRLEFSFAQAPGGPLPHGDPALAKAVLRQRLTDYVLAHPEVLREQTAEPSILPTVPPKAPAELQQKAADADAARWKWVESQLRELCGRIQEPSPLLVDPSAGQSPTAPGRRIQTGCAYCHQIRESDAGNWSVLTPNIPQRWMPMARFSHRSHAMVACQKCHYDSGQGQEPLVPDRSSDTADLMMPGIQVCRECHTVSGRNSHPGSAASRCVDCHRYHGRSHDRIRSWTGIQGENE